MKKLKILVLCASILLVWSCADQWDEHYSNHDLDNVESSPLNLLDFLKTKAEYSDFVAAVEADSFLVSQLQADQNMTVWALDNDAMAQMNAVVAETGLDMDYLIRFHVNSFSYSLSKLKDGLRLVSLNGKYIAVDEQGAGLYTVAGCEISTGDLFCKNGVVHEVSKIMTPQLSIYEYLLSLGDDYSVIRDTLLALNKTVFDPNNSIPIGVDKTGNTIYDSAFLVTNDILDSAGILSEFSQSTMLLPSNQVIADCFQELATLKEVQFDTTLLKEDTLLAMNWIKRAIFYDYVVEDYGSEQDIYSVFGKVWRTTVQKASEEPVVLSNGTVHEISYLHIPNNINLDRFKELVSYYEFLPDSEKERLYTFTGATAYSVRSADVVSFPDLGIPSWTYKILQVEGDPSDDIPVSVEFTAIRRVTLDNGVTSAEPTVVPPGEYNLYMGFQSKNHPFINVYINDVPVKLDADVSPSTPWNYDRRNFERPEGSKWNGAGGLVGTIVIESDGLAEFRLKVEFSRAQAGQTNELMKLYHWCLIPTENNY